MITDELKLKNPGDVIAYRKYLITKGLHDKYYISRDNVHIATKRTEEEAKKDIDAIAFD